MAWSSQRWKPKPPNNESESADAWQDESADAWQDESADSWQDDQLYYALDQVFRRTWAGSKREHYTFRTLSANSWCCTRQDAFSKRPYTVVLDALNWKLWWGSETFYLDISDVANDPNLQEVKWYPAADTNKRRPFFVWHSVEVGPSIMDSLYNVTGAGRRPARRAQAAANGDDHASETHSWYSHPTEAAHDDTSVPHRGKQNKMSWRPKSEQQEEGAAGAAPSTEPPEQGVGSAPQGPSHEDAQYTPEDPWQRRSKNKRGGDDYGWNDAPPPTGSTNAWANWRPSYTPSQYNSDGRGWNEQASGPTYTQGGARFDAHTRGSAAHTAEPPLTVITDGSAARYQKKDLDETFGYTSECGGCFFEQAPVSCGTKTGKDPLGSQWRPAVTPQHTGPSSSNLANGASSSSPWWQKTFFPNLADPPESRGAAGPAPPPPPARDADGAPNAIQEQEISRLRSVALQQAQQQAKIQQEVLNKLAEAPGEQRSAQSAAATASYDRSSRADPNFAKTLQAFAGTLVDVAEDTDSTGHTCSNTGPQSAKPPTTVHDRPPPPPGFEHLAFEGPADNERCRHANATCNADVSQRSQGMQSQQWLQPGTHAMQPVDAFPPGLGPYDSHYMGGNTNGTGCDVRAYGRTGV